MEPLSSKILNDQILSMRKEVKKVIVHQIHGLTRKIDKLRAKKGTEDEKEKNGAKADNYASEVLLLKKLKPEEVALFALANPEESELSRLIAKQVISLQTRATAKLCLRDSIKKIVKDFISKYCESLELLNKLINDRYNKACISNKNKKKKKRGKSKKSDTQIKKEQQINVINEKELPGSSEPVPLNLNAIQSVFKEAGEFILRSLEQELSDNDRDDHSDESSNESDLNNGKEPESDNRVENDKDGFFKRKWKKMNTDSIIKNKIPNQKVNAISNENLKSLSSDIEEESDTISSINEVHHKKGRQDRKTVDPFFKTKDDSEYLTYCEIKNTPSNDQPNFKEKNYEGGVKADERKNRSTFRGDYNDGSFVGGKMNGSFKARNERKLFRGDTNSLFNKNRANRSSFGHEHINATFRREKDRNFFKGNHDKKSYNKGFKRSLNENSNSSFKFQAKKSKILVSNNREQQALDSEKSKQENIKLHPSWEAKKNLNKGVVPFQGKKITFDD